MKYLLSFFSCLFAICLNAQVDLSYQTPPKEIMEVADASLPPVLRMNSEATKGVLLYRKSFKSIAELSEKEMRLGGLRINPKKNVSSRLRYYYDMKLYDVVTGKESMITGLPANAQLANFRMSDDEQMMAFTNTDDKGVALWILNMDSGTIKKLTDSDLNANMGTPFLWNKDSESLLVKVLPQKRNELIDVAAAIPSGPTISVNDGKKAQNRTYQDLLKNKNDEANFETLALSEVKKVDVNGKTSDFLPRDIYSSWSYSPDGNYMMVTTVNKPYSYLVPYRRFPSTTNIYDAEGQFVKTLLDLPLIEDLPKGFMSVRTGPRSYSWRSDRPATLIWAEALDGGDANVEAEYRDAVYQADAPFSGDKKLLIQTKNRFSGIQWCNDDMAIAYDYWWNTRNTKTYLFSPADSDQEVKMIGDRNYQDRYTNPGSFVTEKNAYNRRVLVIDGESLYRIGDGYSDEGIRPFVDKYNVHTGETERLFRADGKTTLEDISSAIDIKKGLVLTRIESPTEYPNYYIRNLQTKNLQQITDFDNPFKAMQNVHKEVINYKRDDGLDLSATLYLPVGYDKKSGEKLPMVMWAYPREYKDKNTASQVTSSPNEFTFPYYGSPLYWVLRGYAVLDDCAFPIVGEGEEEPNDSFRSQLVGNAKAAIDAVDKMGYIDRDRVAVGGHSYGAFMTANLLSHSDLFAAGIARSGAYNRTLTPFGFQSEQRSYWEAPDVYYTMSPFMHADKMKTPLLLIHGEADNNSGTYPMQSERYFNALKGLGATVRLVMLPKESHGYAARESVLHILWEQDQWLDKYVKNKKKVNTP